MAIKWPFRFPTHLMSVAALPGETEQVQHEIKRKINASKFNHYRYVIALITVRSTVFAVLCSRKFMGCCLEISMNSKSTGCSLKQNIVNPAINEWRMHLCLCLHKWPIFRIFTVSSCTTKRFNKLSTKVLKI